MLETDLLTTSNSSTFARELARFGPGQATATPLAEAVAYCNRLATSHYENFVVASLLLPRRLRQDFRTIYAYCRWSDDLADEMESAQQSLQLLQWWQSELDCCWEGQPRHPVMVALQDVIDRHQLPPQPFYDLLSAFRQDQHQQRYADDAQLLDYCRRSANPVGRILLHLGHAATPTTCTLSDHICTGLQLANFCQDMARDAAIGRIYVPQSRWAAHGVSEAMILARQPCEGLQALLAQWVETARDHLLAGQSLPRLLPAWLARDVRLFVGGGLAVCTAIARQGYDVWTRRPQVSRWTQLRLLCTCCLPYRGVASR